MKWNQLDNYYEGKGCECGAYHFYECGCEDASWAPKIQVVVESVLKMTNQEMRLYFGEMTQDEILTVKAILNAIVTKSQRNKWT